MKCPDELRQAVKARVLQRLLGEFTGQTPSAVLIDRINQRAAEVLAEELLELPTGLELPGIRGGLNPYAPGQLVVMFEDEHLIEYLEVQ